MGCDLIGFGVVVDFDEWCVECGFGFVCEFF